MSSPDEGSNADLFDFEQLPELEDFGLVPAVTAAHVEELEAEEALSSGGAQGPLDGAGADAGTTAPPRANPPVPAGVSDLDEDLFGFDELFSIDDDPYSNGTLNADGTPAQPLPPISETPDPFVDPGAADIAQEPQPAPAPPGAPTAAPATRVAAAQNQAPAPSAPSAPSASPAPSAPPRANDLFDEAVRHPLHVQTDLSAGADHSAAGYAPSLRDRGPRILLPEDVPYGDRASRQPLIWALVACFLAVNTAIFFLAQRSNSSFQSSLRDATHVLAEALAQRTGAPTHAAAPVEIDPGVSHSVVVPTDPQSEAPGSQPSRTETWVDPRDYENTHDIAVGTAKAMLTEGRFEDARRLLNHVLANQHRIPLSPELREEIDYLIPLTYFEEGRATAEGAR